MLDLTQYIKRLADNTVIPMNPDNTDYQAYLKWVAEGNTPLPAEDRVLVSAELQDADGNVMTQEQANQFVGGLA
jgi:hypothetical protein